MYYRTPKFKGSIYKQINSIMADEVNLFKENLNLIGSGSYPFKNVLAALGTPMALNPAEGFPNKRYFPACENLDNLELLGNKLALEFFNASSDEYSVSLQPHSGTQANHIVFNAIYKQHEKQVIISMSSDSGGHVSHNFYPKTFFELINYHVEEDGSINYKKIDMLCRTYKPILLIGGASSYPREIDYPKLASICSKYNIMLLADISHTAALIAGGKHLSPFGYANFITMTTNKGTRGPRGGIVYYQKEYKKIIQNSIFPLTQGSPKYNEILSKVVMFTELKTMDFDKYVDKILSLSLLMSTYFLSKDCKLYTRGSKSHLIVLDLSNHDFSGKEAEEKLQNIHILANRNMIPNDKRSPLETSGIRFGTVCPACLDMSDKDFLIITEAIYDCLFLNDLSKANTVKSILNKYQLQI